MGVHQSKEVTKKAPLTIEEQFLITVLGWGVGIMLLFIGATVVSSWLNGLG